MGPKSKRLKTATTKQDICPTAAAAAAAEIPPPLPDGWDRCHAYLESKRRYCRQFPKGYNPNNKEEFKINNENNVPVYCGNHQHFLEEQNEKEGENEDINGQRLMSNTPNQQSDSKKANRRKRIPCPVDPSHFIFSDTIEKHIQVCPGTKKAKQLKEQPFYRHNINTGGHGSLLDKMIEQDQNRDNKTTTACDGTNTRTTDSNSEKLEWAQRVALRVLSVHQDIFSTPPPTTSETVKDSSEQKSSESYNIELSGGAML